MRFFAKITKFVFSAFATNFLVVLKRMSNSKGIIYYPAYILLEEKQKASTGDNIQAIKVAVSDVVNGKKELRQYIMTPDEINDILVDYPLHFRAETNESLVMAVYKHDCFVHCEVDTLTVLISMGDVTIVDLFREGKYYLSFHMMKESD